MLSQYFLRRVTITEWVIGQGTYIYRDEILQRLAHFQTFDMQVTSVKEVVDPIIAFVISLRAKKNEHDTRLIRSDRITSDCATSLS
jgi:hypothetical protein